MSFTYSTLKTALQDYTQNDETSFVTNLPTFIRLAEERVLKSVQLNVFQKNVSGSMTSSNQYLAVPSDFLSSFSLNITNSSSFEYLQFKSLEFVQTYNPNSSTTGTPKYYAQFDVDNFILAPTPDTSFTVNLSYFYRPSSLTAGSDSGTSWLSENAELALLYGALLEAYTYMKGEPDLISLYNNRFMESLSRLKDLGEAKEVSDEYNLGQIRKAKT
ncbi:MAG TPA: hypothetical protein DEB18_03170 [Leeuwenhoekiella sp.]|jgi:hypothetical protein|nr:hypothetical protein [Leeuwenhoekiella sp.]